MLSHIAPTDNDYQTGNVFSRIWVKIMLAVGIAVCSIMTVFIINIEKRSYDHAQQDIAAQQKLITEGQAVLLSEHVFEADSLATFRILSGILANPSITGVRIDYATGGEPILLGDIDDGLLYELQINHYDDTTDELYRLGTITTASTTRFLAQKFRERSKQLLLMILVVLGAILLITALCIHYFVGIPLGKIVTNINATSKDGIKPIDWSSGDEMGYVVKQLNFLQEQQRLRESGLQKAIDDNEEREKRRINSLVNATLEGIVILNNQTILEMNEPMASLLGSSIPQLMEQPLEQLFNQEILAFLDSDISGDEVLPFESTLHSGLASDQDESGIYVEIHLRPIEYGADNAVVAVFRDITARVHAEKEMRYLARYDSLSGLPNRCYFMDELDAILTEGEVADRDFAVMYIDLDYFKEVNDTLGHEAGDEVLRRMGDIMKSLCADRHFSARLGGDEFAVIYNWNPIPSGIDASDSVHPLSPFNPQHFAERTLELVEQCRQAMSLDGNFGVSIGIALQHKGSTIDPDLLTNADAALYASKADGRNTFTLYKSDLPLQRHIHTIAV